MDRILLKKDLGILDIVAEYKVKAPSVDAAMAAYRAAEAYSDEVDVPDLNNLAMTATPEQIIDLIDTTAARVMLRPARQEARGDVLAACARRVVSELRAVAPALIDALAGPWNTAAETFTEALAQLPPNAHDATRLVAAGSGAVAALERLQAAQATMDRLAAVRDTLADVHAISAAGVSNNPVELGTRYVTVTDTAIARQCIKPTPAPVGGRWATLLATHGVKDLCWRNLNDHRAYIARLPEPEPQRIGRRVSVLR